MSTTNQREGIGDDKLAEVANAEETEVEGHSATNITESAASEAPGAMNLSEDDVEGHSATNFSATNVSDAPGAMNLDEDDVEGHSATN